MRPISCSAYFASYHYKLDINLHIPKVHPRLLCRCQTFGCTCPSARTCRHLRGFLLFNVRPVCHTGSGRWTNYIGHGSAPQEGRRNVYGFFFFFLNRQWVQALCDKYKLNMHHITISIDKTVRLLGRGKRGHILVRSAYEDRKRATSNAKSQGRNQGRS